MFKFPRLRGAAEIAEDAAREAATQDAARAVTIQRLQVGLIGLGSMVLLVGLANVIQDRARLAEELSVPEAAPTVAPAEPPALSDPLADAGVVPDLPAEPTPTQSPAIVPEQGDGANDPAP